MPDPKKSVGQANDLNPGRIVRGAPVGGSAARARVGPDIQRVGGRHFHQHRAADHVGTVVAATSEHNVAGPVLIGIRLEGTKGTIGRGDTAGKLVDPSRRRGKRRSVESIVGIPDLVAKGNGAGNGTGWQRRCGARRIVQANIA